MGVWDEHKEVLAVSVWWEDFTPLEYARLAKVDPGQAVESTRVLCEAHLLSHRRNHTTYAGVVVLVEGCFAERSCQVDRLLALGCQVGWRLAGDTVWLADRQPERLHESARRLKLAKGDEVKTWGEEIPRVEVRGQGKWANVQEQGVTLAELPWDLDARWDIRTKPGQLRVVPPTLATNLREGVERSRGQHEGVYLWYRVGEFYEAYQEQAEELSTLLELTLTTREVQEGVRWPMVGVPYHALDTYLHRLTAKGHDTALVDLQPFLTTEEVQVRQLLPLPGQGQAVGVDFLQQTSNLSLPEVQAALVTLELKGQAKRLPGNLFLRR